MCVRVAVEWQMCAVLGRLNQQNTKAIEFAWPPSVLSMAPDEGVFGKCHGFTDATCAMPNTGFANDDIYYLEICLFSQVCANREQLFKLEQGDEFVCHFDPHAFDELKGWLLRGPDF